MLVSLASALGSSPRPAIQKKREKGNVIMDNELKELAKCMRECADIFDEISECKDKDKMKKLKGGLKELKGKLVVKFAKLIAVVSK